MNKTARRAAWTVFWVLTLFETLTMGMAGTGKLNGTLWQTMFVGWGYPAWFATVIGVFETAGAIGVLIPRVAHYAAGGLIPIMLGALYTVLTRENQLGWRSAVTHLVLLTLILTVRSGVFARVGAVKNGVVQKATA